MMDVEKLVEGVAMALLAARIRRGIRPIQLGDEAYEADLALARSAILATLRGVREADEGMREAYKDAEDDYNDHPCEFYINTERYTAMIDHLIKAVEG
jgi:hypothetical protein